MALVTAFSTVIILLALLIQTLHSCLDLTENNRPVLFCQASVHRLPLDREKIPGELAKLRILGAEVSDSPHNGQLSSFNLTGLETLTYLEISNFNLREVQTDAFRAMRQLRVLDLSRNRITAVQPGAFNGLTLSLLSLTDNTGLTFARGAFRGSQVRNLAARNCNIRELEYATISEAKPKQLGLSQNQISWLDPRFENLVKPSWESGAQTYGTSIDDWGSIDLTNNPLECNCHLMWLSKLLEEQLYLSLRFNTKAISTAPAATSNSENPIEVPTKRMFQLNLTCGSPPELAGRQLPRSWHFFCPKPQVVSIGINLLTAQADHAQLTCIGQGQPPPGLAWTYRINGHKVQKTLDPMVQSTAEKIPIHHRYDEYGVPVNHADERSLHERSIALNVSLREPGVKNFTCTVWNDDSPRIQDVNGPFDMLDRYKAGKMNLPNEDTVDLSHKYRMQEVTVRLYGPSKPINEADSIPLTFKSFKSAATSMHNHTAAVIEPETNEKVLRLAIAGTYDYLFVERFSLLQLLGAVFGTFVVTLALLYAVTNILSCFCHSFQMPVKEPTRSIRNGKLYKHWFTIFKARDADLTNSSQKADLTDQSMSECSPPMNASLAKASNFESAFSFLTSNPNCNSTAGPSSGSGRRRPLSHTLSRTTLPVPSCGRSSNTPPPNPAYWPMPEYTYTGTGGHEYDVPRPLEPLIGSNALIRPGLLEFQGSGAGTTHPFLNLTNPPLLTGSIHFPFHENVLSRPAIFPPSVSTLSQIPGHWSNTTHPSGSITNTLHAWGQVGSNTTAELTRSGRQTQTGSYTQYPFPQSIVYAGDYPTYLQTRPYPHHQPQPLFQLMTNSAKQIQLSSSMDSDQGIDNPQTASNTQDSLKPNNSSSHTTETNSSLNGSSP